MQFQTGRELKTCVGISINLFLVPSGKGVPCHRHISALAYNSMFALEEVLFGLTKRISFGNRLVIRKIGG
jgi:hypothetical protein